MQNNITPTVGNTVTVETRERLYQTLTSKDKLVKLSVIPIGSHFNGIMWATRIYTTPNRYDKNTFDIHFELVDCDGKFIKAVKYGWEKKLELLNTPILVEAMSYSHDAGKTCIYQILSFTTTTVSVDINYFLKEITNLDKEKEQFIQNYNSIQSAGLKGIVGTIINKGLLDILSRQTYKPNLGTRLGAGIYVSNLLVAYRNVLCNFSDIDWDCYTAAALLLNYSSISNDEQQCSYMPIDPVINMLLLQDITLSDKTKGTLYNILFKGTPEIVTPERSIFYTNLQSIEQVFKVSDF